MHSYPFLPVLEICTGVCTTYTLIVCVKCRLAFCLGQDYFLLTLVNIVYILWIRGAIPVIVWGSIFATFVSLIIHSVVLSPVILGSLYVSYYC